jgi:TatD DNase family protein
MIETDCPFLTPKNMLPRPQQNEPQYLGVVAQELAACYKLPLEEIVKRTTENANLFFGLSS